MSALEVGPERVAITTPDGRIFEERANPREIVSDRLRRHKHALGRDSGGVLHECGRLELPHGAVRLHPGWRRARKRAAPWAGLSAPPVARLFLLPKYSSDLNPIEQFFAKLKH
jgi:transposase